MIAAEHFPHLFCELTVGKCSLANRIVSTGHHTYLADKLPDERLIAYHEARAKGGVGLIISEIVAVHETAGFSSNVLTVENRDAIKPYSKLVSACHQHNTKIFAQLFHPGREILSSPSGMLPIAWAPSAIPNERFHIMPRPMSTELVRDIIEGYGRTAALLAEAGFDGFEIVASHGYLPAQFLNPLTNVRDDKYGGDENRRLKFLKDVIQCIRENIDQQVVGLRISGSEMDSTGLTSEQVSKVCTTFESSLDYVNITAGTSASLGGSVHITPPMGIEHAYLAPYAKTIRENISIPVLLSGRINQPQVAEQVISEGSADLCGLTRALICDPAMPGKARDGNVDAIRACIGCNQSCIGRAHKGLGISCIQYPQSGRELLYSSTPKSNISKTILVAGGGPAGMKAASTAAQRGHKVTLYESSAQLGGQALLAQRLPGREEFGGIITNFEYEMQEAGVEVLRNQALTVDQVKQSNPDAVIIATGARPYLPEFEGLESEHVVSAWDVLQNKVTVGASVVIADWRADWIGLGIAEQLALQGCDVTLCVNAAMVGESLQIYTRNHYVSRLHKLKVRTQTHLRLFGVMEDSVFFQDTLCEEAVEFNSIDTLVISLGHQPVDQLSTKIKALGTTVHTIGDCVSARTAEEAVFEGLQSGWNI